MRERLSQMAEAGGEHARDAAVALGDLATKAFYGSKGLVTPGPTGKKFGIRALRGAGRDGEMVEFRRKVPDSVGQLDAPLDHAPDPKLNRPNFKKGMIADHSAYRATRRGSKAAKTRLRTGLMKGGLGGNNPHEVNSGRDEGQYRRPYEIAVGNLSDLVFVPAAAEKEARVERQAEDWLGQVSATLTNQNAGTKVDEVEKLINRLGDYENTAHPLHRSSLYQKLRTITSAPDVDGDELQNQIKGLLLNGGVRNPVIQKRHMVHLLHIAENGTEDQFNQRLRELDGHGQVKENDQIVMPILPGEKVPRVRPPSIGETIFAKSLAQAKTKRGEEFMRDYLVDASEQLSDPTTCQAMRDAIAQLDHLSARNGHLPFQNRLRLALNAVGLNQVINGLNQLENTRGPTRFKGSNVPIDAPEGIPKQEPGAKTIEDIKIGKMFEEFLDKVPSRQANHYLSRLEKDVNPSINDQRARQAKKHVEDLVDDYVGKHYPYANLLDKPKEYKADLQARGLGWRDRLALDEGLGGLRKYQSKMRKAEKIDRKQKRVGDGKDVYSRYLQAKADNRRRHGTRMIRKHRNYRRDVPAYGPGYGPWTNGAANNDNPWVRRGSGVLFDVPAYARRKAAVHRRVISALGAESKTMIKRNYMLQLARARRSKFGELYLPSLSRGRRR